MIKEPNQLAAARAALSKTDLGDPAKLVHLKDAIGSLLRIMSGASPKIEKDIATKLLLTHRSKALAEVKLILIKGDSQVPESLDHWNNVMEVFGKLELDDPEFNACKEQILARRRSRLNGKLGATLLPIRQGALQEAARQKNLELRIMKDSRPMRHAESLRAIGQSLDMLRLRVFHLEKTGEFHIVRSESLTETHQWILRNSLAEIILDPSAAHPESAEPTVTDRSLCYGPLDIARLNAWIRNKGTRPHREQAHEADKLPHLLRTLGEHLDSKKATAFRISWNVDAVSVEYQTPSGVREHKEFTVKRLQHLASYSRFQRSSHSHSIDSR